MNVKEQHYDIKKKLNKVDSQQFRNLLIPELDIAINEAVEIFIKLVAFPRFRTVLGFEKSQRSIDDIRSLVESEDNPDNLLAVTANLVALPLNYMFYISSYALVSKGSCINVKVSVTIPQHDDTSKFDSYYKSSFEWRTLNAKFDSQGIRFENDGSFEVNKLGLSYIRQPLYIHNAEDFSVTGYTSPSGTQYEGVQSCELPAHTHREINDIAVMLLSGELKNPGYEYTVAKLKLNQLN